MGPVAVAWRRGIGLRFGSTDRAVDQRIHEYYKSSGITIDGAGEDDPQRRDHLYRAMDALGIGETEYSLRWLPIGGFVKMLGQEDANPHYASNDPRSYTRCPVGKRMIVVSAGVIMNLVLAVILFIIAFSASRPL
jgi:regulator of sigma E protease